VEGGDVGGNGDGAALHSAVICAIAPKALALFRCVRLCSWAMAVTHAKRAVNLDVNEINACTRTH
jgi:hypothetical protein